jgi:c-di-GMP-related signal transduction protein
MEVHIARQPIFDIHKKLFAYELLFRQTMGLRLGELSGDRATTSLLSTAFLTEGVETIAGNKPCFITFSKDLLIQEIAASFPKNRIIVEILKEVPPSPDVLAACRSLSQQGYILALDDFVYAPELLPLIELVNIVKIDFHLLTPEQIERTLYRLRRFHLKFLAEKIESYDELEHARKLGFHYFQGYFFARPESLRITEIASNKINLLRLLAEINNRQTTVTRLEEIITADVAIAYKLLRYINSAFFYLLKEVESIRQAITYLGEQEIRKFVTLVLISELAADKPTELVRLSVVRARFCELLADRCPQEVSGSELFLLGLFSLIDAILDAPMEQMMERLPLSDAIKEALIRGEGSYAPLLTAVIAYEKGETVNCLTALAQLQADKKDLSTLYLQAVQFAAIIT